MKSIQTIIIDDERLAREELKSLLSEFIEIEVIDEAHNGDDALEKINRLKPDLIFLDVSMPGMTGFELVKKLDDIPQIIFVTAFDEHAMKAFDLQAIDYILKPIDPTRLAQAIKRVSAENIDSMTSEEDIRSNKMLCPTDKVFIKDGEKCWFIELDKIRMMESEGNYVKVYFDQFRPMILRSLNNFENKLNPEFFFRANRKYLINLNHVVSVEAWFNGGLKVELSKGEKIEISRRQAIRFKEIFSL
jgi:two-component system LytT family response regulator